MVLTGSDHLGSFVVLFCSSLLVFLCYSFLISLLFPNFLKVRSIGRPDTLGPDRISMYTG